MENSNQESHLRSDNSITYESPYPLYAMAFSSSPSPNHNHHQRIAVGSFIEEYSNRVEILSFDLETLSFKTHPTLSLDHPYPPTKLMFHPAAPSSLRKSSDLLASSGDFLRLWEVRESSVEPISVLNNSKTSEFFAPLTWSVRIFDLRDKEHSTIIYESPQPDTPLLRLAWNKQDLRYMATILMDSNKVVILDIRSPTMPVAELERHRASVNAIAWAPQSCRHICSAGDDAQALIWDLPTVAGPNGIDPMSMYSATAEINQLQWSAAQPDWIAIAFSSKMQLLKV
ncbi:hypothetical protein GH714_006831 [Hevea brasiliensis]|uniref:Uncharacterized protein n=1 Tax=Hevea brasiliensis TaxID=3981 RepID=A0A6A6MXA5_HEVBR|nr:hypothetical protein GH714_006831 [Hevea brasiliensis]